MVSAEKEELEVLSLLKKKGKEQVEIFPEFYAVLEDFGKRLSHIEAQQTVIINLLNSKLELDKKEEELLDLMITRAKKGL